MTRLLQERKLMSVPIARDTQDLYMLYHMDETSAKALCKMYGFTIKGKYYIDKDKAEKLYEKGIVADVIKRWAGKSAYMLRRLPSQQEKFDADNNDRW